MGKCFKKPEVKSKLTRFIKIEKDDGSEFRVGDNDHTFYFSVSNPHFDPNKKPCINLDLAPHSQSKTDPYTSKTFLIASVEGNFTQWLNNVKAYDEISLTADEERSKQYEKEFFEEYKILDEDADTAAFEHEKQIFLYNLLTNLQEQLRLENKR